MVRNTPQFHGTGDGGDSETVVLHRHTLRNTCIAATIAAVLLTAGSLLSAKYYTANQNLQRRSPTSAPACTNPPHTAAALQSQIEALKHQLATARQELAARSRNAGGTDPSV